MRRRKENRMKWFKWEKKYLRWGVTAFFVIAASIVFYMLLHYVSGLMSALKSLMNILSPFIWGLVIAYLLKPLMLFYQRKIFDPLGRKSRLKRGKSDTGTYKGSRGLSVTLAEITMIFIFGALIYLILPQVYSSIQALVVNSPTYVQKTVDWAEKLLKDYPQIESYATSALGNITDMFNNWVQNKVLPGIDNVIQNVTSGVIFILKGIYNATIGIIVSVYILHNTELFEAHSKKTLYAIFNLNSAERIRKNLDFADKVFMGFITGKLLDSAIIGLMCYVFCVIAKMPYPLLISVIVGVTNIIPFFGPFIGAVPSALLVLMVSPMQCLIFIVFIFLLQQFDGNILGPKILGSTTGINGFWVMFAIILGAGLFGFWGMVLGVPVWVIIYTWLSRGVEKKLKESDLPNDSELYVNMDYIDPQTREFVYKAEKEKEPPKNEQPHEEDNSQE
jgi:predicted PurR-regulated permease PerM